MAVSGKGVSMSGGTKISTLVRNGKVSQAGIRRELAAQRRAGNAKQVAGAMKTWGLRQGKGKSAAQNTGIVRKTGTITGRKG